MNRLVAVIIATPGASQKLISIAKRLNGTNYGRNYRNTLRFSNSCSMAALVAGETLRARDAEKSQAVFAPEVSELTLIYRPINRAGGIGGCAYFLP